MAYHRDRDITSEIPPYRRMLAYVTPSRLHATVTFTQRLDLNAAQAWLAQQSEARGRRLSFLHLHLAAVGRTLHRHPRLNRYCTGTRFFQREEVLLAVSAKKQLVDGARVVLLKLAMAEDDSPWAVAERLDAQLQPARDGETLTQETENALLLRLGPLLPPLLRLAMWLDRRHWLPGWLVDPDPMFASMVVANLGSVGLEVANHHLYEWGNCPFFAVIGRISEDGFVEVSYSFDERVEDGLACALALEELRGVIERPGVVWGEAP
ncbi:MAG: 2-oxo acid dehydrogenase subunit E2 [Alphaproteobacteria bacterium]|nr:2-oxo acid dehydrogenase subunit E2 [Alphaproteobacteria bacterium]